MSDLFIVVHSFLCVCDLSLQIACKVVALLLHYFYMAAFTWMCCEGIHLYTKVVEVFSEGSKMNYYYALGWGNALHRTVPYLAVPYCIRITVRHCIALYCTVPFCTVLCCAVLCRAVPCRAVPYRTVLYCTVDSIRSTRT